MFSFEKRKKKSLVWQFVCFFVFVLPVLFHVSVFAFITSCYHCRLPGHSVSRLRISLVLYSMFCLPRLFLFVATRSSLSSLVLFCIDFLYFCFFTVLFCFFYRAPLADMLVTSSIILRGLQIPCYYYYWNDRRSRCVFLSFYSAIFQLTSA